jgi:hypothetical protein
MWGINICGCLGIENFHLLFKLLKGNINFQVIFTIYQNELDSQSNKEKNIFLYENILHF